MTSSHDPWWFCYGLLYWTPLDLSCAFAYNNTTFCSQGSRIYSCIHWLRGHTVCLFFCAPAKAEKLKFVAWPKQLATTPGKKTNFFSYIVEQLQSPDSNFPIFKHISFMTSSTRYSNSSKLKWNFSSFQSHPSLLLQQDCSPLECFTYTIDLNSFFQTIKRFLLLVFWSHFIILTLIQLFLSLSTSFVPVACVDWPL